MPSSSVQRTTSVRTMTSIQPTEPTLSERRRAENGRNNTSILKDFVAMDGWTINDHRTHPKTHPKSWWQKATDWMSFEFLPRWQTRGAYFSCFGWRMSLFFRRPFFSTSMFVKVYRPPAFDDPPTFPEPTVPTVPSQAIFFHWGWWEKHGIEIKDGGFFRFRLLTKSCVQLVTRMHIPSNMFKHHHWILISSTYPQYFGHIPYHWWCDFVWQWLNNQKHQKANVHQNVHQFHVTSICFSLTQLRNQNVCNGAAKRIAWISLVRTWDASRISHLSFLVSLIRWLPWCSLMVMLEAEMEKNFSLLVKDWNQG